MHPYAKLVEGQSVVSSSGCGGSARLLSLRPVARAAGGRAMSALTVIEAARISAVVEEALEKLSFLASITPDVMAHRDELSQIVGDEITRIIQEQRGLETRYEQLISQRTSLKALSNKNKFNENQEQVKEVAKALRESTKELCRNLKVRPRPVPYVLAPAPIRIDHY